MTIERRTDLVNIFHVILLSWRCRRRCRCRFFLTLSLSLVVCFFPKFSLNYSFCLLTLSLFLMCCMRWHSVLFTSKIFSIQMYRVRRNSRCMTCATCVCICALCLVTWALFLWHFSWQLAYAVHMCFDGVTFQSSVHQVRNEKERKKTTTTKNSLDL